MSGHPEVSERPRYSLDEAAAMAADYFALAVRPEALPSERDQNFLLHSEDGDRYVLKIANPGETRASLELQDQAMQRVAKAFGNRAVCPRVLPSRKGEAIVALARGHLRLLSYLPGTPLAGFRPHRGELLADLGQFLARLDQALVGLDTQHEPALLWDLERAGQIFAECCPLLEPGQRDRLAPIVNDHQRVQARLADLPRQVIHNDANDHNILVGGDRWRPRITGIIDFGDMLGSRAVVDLAIACAYVMLGKRDPLAAASQVVTGYHRVRPLSEAELALLFPLAMARLAMAVCIAARQSRAAPEVAYLRISEASAWRALKKLS